MLTLTQLLKADVPAAVVVHLLEHLADALNLLWRQARCNHLAQRGNSAHRGAPV